MGKLMDRDEEAYRALRNICNELAHECDIPSEIIHVIVSGGESEIQIFGHYPDEFITRFQREAWRRFGGGL